MFLYCVSIILYMYKTTLRMCRTTLILVSMTQYMYSVVLHPVSATLYLFKAPLTGDCQRKHPDRLIVHRCTTNLSGFRAAVVMCICALHMCKASTIFVVALFHRLLDASFSSAFFQCFHDVFLKIEVRSA